MTIASWPGGGGGGGGGGPNGVEVGNTVGVAVVGAEVGVLVGPKVGGAEGVSEQKKDYTRNTQGERKCVWFPVVTLLNGYLLEQLYFLFRTFSSSSPSWNASCSWT